MPYIGRTLGQGTRSRFLYTATAGQTTFSGSDTQSTTLAYSDNNGVDCFQNGVLLKGGGADYTATSGTSVVLTTGASVSDVIEILVYDVFAIADHVKKSGDTMTGALTNIDVNGTELILDADGDTSITSDTDDQIDIKVGGSDKVHVTSTGLGIGTSSPTMPLDVICADNKNIVSRESTSNITNGFEIVSNDSSNQAQLVSNSATGEVNLGAINTNYFLTFSTNGTNERMRIDTSGNVLIGTTSTSAATAQGIILNPSSGLHMNNSTSSAGISLILLYSSHSTTDQTKFEVTSEGNVKSRTNSYAGFSDERLKEQIVDASSQWDDIKAIEIKNFKFISNLDDADNPKMLGVIAQQVEKVSPNLVEIDPKDEMKTVKYSLLYLKAVKALQEAMARIEALEAKVTALESK